MTRWTPEKIAQAEALHAKGCSYRQIGREIGFSHRVVCSMLWRRRHGLVTGEGSRPWTDEDVALLLQLDAQGVQRHEIARLLKRTVVAIERKVVAIRPPEHARPLRQARPSAKRARVNDDYVAPYSRPAWRQNDHEKHLRLIRKANNGQGFPFCVLPASYRRAA